MEHDDQSMDHSPNQPIDDLSNSELGIPKGIEAPESSDSKLFRDAARTIITNNPYAKAALIVAILTLLAGIAFPLADIALSNSQDKGDPGAVHSQSQLSDDKSSPTTGAAGSVAAESLRPGTCLSGSSTDATSVSCQIAHATEVYSSAGICDEATLIAYLGGNPTVDLLRSDLTVRTSPSGICTVTFPPSLTVATSVEGALAGSNSAVLRQCVNNRSGADVDCGEKHTGEVVAVVGKNEPTVVDCNEVATKYMSRSPDDLYLQLTVGPEDFGDGFRCVISAIGSNRLTDTLRMLGTSSVPISAY